MTNYWSLDNRIQGVWVSRCPASWSWDVLLSFFFFNTTHVAGTESVGWVMVLKTESTPCHFPHAGHQQAGKAVGGPAFCAGRWAALAQRPPSSGAWGSPRVPRALMVERPTGHSFCLTVLTSCSFTEESCCPKGSPIHFMKKGLFPLFRSMNFFFCAPLLC